MNNNLLDIIGFMKNNKNFSDYNLISDFLFGLNFTKYRLNNVRGQQGGADGDGDGLGLVHVDDSQILSQQITPHQVLPQPILEPMLQQPMLEQPMLQQPILQQPMLEQPMLQQPILQQPMLEQPMLQQPILQQPMLSQEMIPVGGQQLPMLPTLQPSTLQPATLQPSLEPIRTLDANQEQKFLESQSDQIPIAPQTLQPQQDPLIQIPNNPQQDDIINPNPATTELYEDINSFGQTQLYLGVNQDTECQYKKIRNQDGSFIKQKICGQKIVTMPDIYLPKPNFTSSGTNTYTIKKGTVLYHATINKRGFNTNQIKLGQDKLISFFTPNFRLASDGVEGCSIDKQKGFIHVFEVIKDIPEIFIKLPYDTDDDLDLNELKDKFCNGNEYYKGVGFFYPKNEIELFNNSVFNQRTQEMHENLDDDNYYSEFALCSPSDFLKYIYTQKCMSLRKLSQPYRFDDKNYN
ncbi:MAG: hypothetical protein Gaeavirus32_5 [Gaeavirus sp.]|uniref:Uncharacterized protein n=1 Tax=Gaeavirus sp. TaxID=2487767 RepID=A0A3G4ZZH8_9VIRU|nr:MAG: hypothetical protein Gaeavirus32_5 [Gaeavirus sp.]